MNWVKEYGKFVDSTCMQATMGWLNKKLIKLGLQHLDPALANLTRAGAWTYEVSINHTVPIQTETSLDHGDGQRMNLDDFVMHI